MSKSWVALLAGVVFGLGLGLGGMAQPLKVTAFLDVFGQWDPSLVFVMIGAIGVHMPVALWRRKAVKDDAVAGCAVPASTPPAKRVDASLIIGAAVFGVGWGIGGFCPGPAFVSSGAGVLSALVFVVGMAAAMAMHAYIVSRRGRP